jgi:glycosyltransferase involved in cell wall biosynthesis
MPFKNPFGYILNIPFLFINLRSLKPDLIHSFYAFGHSFLARMTGYNPHIVSVLGSDIYDDTEKNGFYKWIIKKNVIKADIICSTSFVMRDRIKEIAGKDLDIQITPFGVDVKKFKVLKGNKDNDYELTLGTVKKLDDKYGIDTLIQSFALFAKKYPGLKSRLIIIGDGSKKDELVQLSKDLKVFEKCEFIGFVKHKEIPEWLNKMDIFLALSRLNSESFGVAVVEALSCELPVIVSNVGGLKEVVENEKTGLIVAKEDPDSAAEKIELLFKNPDLATKLGKNGRSHVVLNYSWKRSLDTMSKIYQAL